jgi:hypothetical protein
MQKTPRADVESALDEMIAETFPASDPPQLDGMLQPAPAANAVPTHPDEHAPPPEVPERPSTARVDVRGGRVSLGDAGEVELRSDAEGIEVTLPANPLHLDARGLEALIAALQKHRPPLPR